MCVFCAPFASRMQLRGIPVSVPGLARHAVPLTPSIAASLSWPSCAAEHAFSAKIPHAGRTNPLPVARYCFKSFSRNAYGSPRKCCKQKTYDPTKPFRCNTYKKQGVGAPPFRNSSLITRHSSLATAVKFFAFTLLRTLLHFSALAQNSTRFFPIASALFVQKHGGVGYALHPYFVTSLLHYRQKRQRPSRSDGGSCEKGAPSSGEKNVTGQRLSFPEAEEAQSSEISLDGLARWCSPRALRTAMPLVPPAEYSSACRWYFQTGDQNACS